MVKYWSSKPTSGVRFPPTSMNVFKLKLSFINVSNMLALLLLTLISVINDWFTGNSFSQKILLILGIAFAMYWIVSIFVFLFKRSLYTSYTVVIQRYWKRALYLFWVLELFLFSIYVYLILVASTEVEWLLDQPQLFNSKWWDGNLFFNKLLPILGVIILTIVSQYVLFNGGRLLLLLLSLAITSLLASTLFSDAVQTYMYSIFFSGLSWTFEVESNLWLLDGSMDKTRTVTQYMFLITLLKFWHTIFIVGVWLVSVMFLTQSPYTGQGVFAANKQNFFFLYGFAFIWLCFLYKSYNNYSYEYVYQWFFVNPWGLGLSSLTSLVDPLWSLVR